MALNGLHRNLEKIIANLLGVVVASLLQYMLITSFISAGLVDPAPLEISLGENLPLISISILFHLVPLNVILIILLSWIYLNKFISKRPRKYKLAKRTVKSKSITKAFYLFNSNLRGVLGVIVLFSFLLFITFMSVYPSILYDFTLHLYWSNNFFRMLIRWSSQINSSLINAVGLFAAYFRNGISSLIKPLSDPLLKANIMWKYLICQNATAWLTAMFILAYCKYYEGKSRRWS